MDQQTSKLLFILPARQGVYLRYTLWQWIGTPILSAVRADPDLTTVGGTVHLAGFSIIEGDAEHGARGLEAQVNSLPAHTAVNAAKQSAEITQESLNRAVALEEGFHGKKNGRVQCRIAAHAPDNCSPWMLAKLNDLAQTYRLRRTTHLAQTIGEVEQVRKVAGVTPAEYLRDNDWLGNDVLAAHWSHCTANDIEILAESGVHITHCPASSSRGGSSCGQHPKHR